MKAPAARSGLVLALCCLAQFMVVLDVAIVNVALPSIQRDLGLRESALQWVVIAYGLLLGGFLLLGGRLGDLLGRRRVFVAGALVFSAASLLAGLAQSAGLLIAARAAQGFGAALLAPSALAIVAVTFAEGAARNRALGLYGAVGGSSASVGVIASGLLTDGPGWRWIFFINVPIGLALAGLTLANLPADRPAAGDRRADLPGAAAVTAGLLALVYGLNRGADHGWSAASTLGLFAAAAILLVGFVAIEARAAAPLVPLPSLRNRAMVAADLSAFLLFGGFFAFIFLGSLLMQQLLAYSPTRTGVAWLATSLTAFVAAGVVGAKLAQSIGVRRLVLLGTILLGLSGIWLARLPAHANYAVDLLPALLLAGFAVGFVAPAIQIGALMGARGAQVGLASGLVETMREIGGAVGIAAVATALISRSSAAADPAARAASALNGFHAAFAVIVALAGLGALLALVAFPPATEPEPETVLREATATAS